VIYDRYAQVYDNSGQVHFSLRMIAYLSDLLPRFGWQGESALDLACGTGTLALAYAQWGLRAYGVDGSAAMLREAGCRWCLAGHSERRQYCGETDETVNRKVRSILASGLAPLLCVGETPAEREAGATDAVLAQQVRAGLAGVTLAAGDDLVVAYEPVWAIGTGRPATAADAGAAGRLIRGTLAAVLGEAAARRVRILYGGSVKPNNIWQFMQELEIDGALVGGASLEPDSFLTLAREAIRKES
jgi:triosephosphate isomerase